MRENGETYTAGKSFTLDRMDIFANKFAQSSFPFVLEWLLSGSRQEMGKSTFGLALSAQLIDLPLLPKVQWHLVEKARFRLYFHWFGNYITPVSMENKIST